METGREERRSEGEARGVHQVLREVCRDLLEAEAFNFVPAGAPKKIVRCLCENPGPMQAGDVEAWIERNLSSDVSNVSTELKRKKDLFGTLTPTWQEKIPHASGLEIGQIGETSAAKRYLNLRGLSLGEVVEIARSLKEILRLEGFEFIEDRPECFRKVEEVLQIGLNVAPKWFRRWGPLAPDLEQGRVHWRTDEEEIGGLLDGLENGKDAVLFGDQATGKSSVARQIAYALFGDGCYPHIWFLECGRIERENIAGRLREEIRQIQGLIIIEDAHLLPGTINRLYSNMLSYNQYLTTLVVSRSILWSRLRDRVPLSPSLFDLREAEQSVQLEPFTVKDSDVADDIIDDFCSASKDLSLSENDARRQALKRNAEGNYWLLAFGLEGGEEAGGGGDPDEWIGGGVNKYLGWLEHCEDSDYSGREGGSEYFPEVVLALSPLYMGEVPTAESYLRGRLGFEKGTLNQLTAMGEIKRLKGPGQESFYGLQHSALAEAYWTHGQQYWTARKREVGFPERMGGELENVIYDYATSEILNGLEAVVEIDRSIRGELLDRLVNEGELLQVVQRSLSAGADRSLIGLLEPDHHPGPIMETIARKVNMADVFPAVAGVVRAVAAEQPEGADHFWTNLCFSGLARKLNESEEFGYVADVIGAVAREGLARKQRGADGFRKKAGEFWEALDLGSLARKVNATEYLMAVSVVISAVAAEQPDEEDHFWQKVKFAELVDKAHFGVRWLFRMRRSLLKATSQDICHYIEDEELRRKVEDYGPGNEGDDED